MPENNLSPNRETGNMFEGAFCAYMLVDIIAEIAAITMNRCAIARVARRTHMKQISATRSVLILFAWLIMCAADVGAQSSVYNYQIIQRGNAAPGYFMISPAKNDTLGVIDNYGRAVFPIDVGMQINLASYKSRDLTYFGVTDNSGVLGLACYVRMNSQLQITDSIYPKGAYQADFHEGFATSDTTFLILGSYRVKTDLSKFVLGGLPDAEIIGGIIQEISRSGRVLFEWKSLDHIPYQDATDDIDFTQSLVDVHHINSIFRDVDGGLIVSFRHLDEIIKIHGTTGQIIWRFGGSKSKHNQFRFLNDTVSGFYGFSHQHSVSRTSRGTILLFDNGNLKPTPCRSRVVEYEIDEQQKTARRVFQYTPAVDVFASTMGNASELSNGNIVIGYGSAAKLAGGFSDIAAEEIDRNGRVVATVNNLPLPRINAYRILKTTFGMTGAQRSITTPGNVVFADGDSTTLVSMQVASVKKPAVVTVERHHYAPRNISYTTPLTLYHPPVRWGIRLDDTAALTGGVKLRLRNIYDVLDPSSALLLYRPTEGSGPFSILSGTYSPTDSTWTLSSLKQGEYAIAYSSRLQPLLLAPLNKSRDVEERPQLRWSKLLFATSYELQIARDSVFSIAVQSRNVSDTMYTPPVLRNNTTFWWRMRKITAQGPGEWSAHWSFTTKFNKPVIIEPSPAVQPAFVNRTQRFRWTHVEGAGSYRLVVSDTASRVLLDTLLQDTVCEVVGALPANELLSWTVAARIDTVLGAPSDRCLITTAPVRPQQTTPEPNVFVPATTAMELAWLPVDNTARFRVIMVRVPGSSPLVDTVVEATSLRVANLPPGRQYEWTVISQGLYGPSLPSTRQFSVAQSTTLSRPVIAGSVERVGVSATQPTVCAWLPVSNAATYHVQAANSVLFDSPEIDTVVTSESVAVLFGRASSLYAWRVQARNGYDISEWSDTVYVSTIVDSSVSIVPLYPIHGSTTAKDADVFRFQGSQLYSSYEVQVARDPRFGAIDFKYYCFTDSTQYAFLTEGARYYWRIVGGGAMGRTFISQASTMVVNSNVSVEDDKEACDPIVLWREGGAVLLKDNGLDRIIAVRIYSVLGELVDIVDSVVLGNTIRITTESYGPSFIVVTFSSGKTYFMRA